MAAAMAAIPTLQLRQQRIQQQTVPAAQAALVQVPVQAAVLIPAWEQVRVLEPALEQPVLAHLPEQEQVLAQVQIQRTTAAPAIKSRCSTCKMLQAKAAKTDLLFLIWPFFAAMQRGLFYLTGFVQL